MLFRKRNLVLICCIVAFCIWGYLVYDINQRFPEPKEYIGRLNEQTDYYGLNVVLEDVSYYEFEELLEIYPDLEKNLNRIWEEDLSYFYDCTYILAKFSLKNDSEAPVNLEISKKTPERMTLELGAYNNGCASFIYPYINKEFDNIVEQNEEIIIYLPFSIYKQYMDMEKIKTYPIRICYQFYPEKRYFQYIPDTV